MSRTDEEMDDTASFDPASFASDRALWRRCRGADMPADEAARFLDLAGFADGLLDDEEHERVAALIAGDPAAAADIAAAQGQSGDGGLAPAAIERIIARAQALVGETAPEYGHILPFAPPPRRGHLLHGVAQWGSLAAAIVVASWLGFAMGSSALLSLSQRSQPNPPSQYGDEGFLRELLDPTTGFLRDPTESQQT